MKLYRFEFEGHREDWPGENIWFGTGGIIAESEEQARRHLIEYCMGRGWRVTRIGLLSKEAV